MLDPSTVLDILPFISCGSFGFGLTMTVAKRVAVIGAGPAGAIAIDALVREQAFDVIRVFERREAAGGCWIGDKNPPPELQRSEITALSSRTADRPVPIPSTLPAQTARTNVPRYTESSIYPYLETNIDYLPMEFTQEPFPTEQSEWSVATHGPDTPFRHWSLVRKYVQDLVSRNGYQDLVSYSTTVERAEKIGNQWKLTLRKGGKRTDYWWVEWFDAVVVASGHYSVPYFPSIDGLAELAEKHPGSVIHSKHFRGSEAYVGKKVVVVGASVSAADIAYDLATTAQSPVHAVMVGHQFNGYFGGDAFDHPRISKKPSITRVQPDTRTVHFADGTLVAGVDALIFGTGYSWTLPFLPSVEVRNNRIPKLYQHVVYQPDPSLVFVGAVGAGLTFKVFEWQAVLAARVLAGRASLPSSEAQAKWEEDRIKARGDGAKFTLVFPDFKEYFDTLRKLAGPTTDGRGRDLPPFDDLWFERFMAGHERRKQMWRRLNAEAQGRGLVATDAAVKVRAML
ncbi:uncharacterized protein E0L32_010233 [Thyridium curvatum]|uniref:Flavin-containing monooxygenase n=1 Tax=Thyridium curvatum TaxID=1093900 RepID=A0A507AKP1_9PEZI|nr:uncharacterized protein E0L32_010233 [Thyridium curvatum]TPX08033.1 hypothetical protein E0L32_010233 [Thyridium curvatum]